MSESVSYTLLYVYKRQRQISTYYSIFSSEWDNNSGMIILYPEGVDTERASIVLSIQERIRWDKVRLNKIIESLDNQESGYTADDVVQQFNDRAKEQSFFDFMLNAVSYTHLDVYKRQQK